jgi:hypothetical protein
VQCGGGGCVCAGMQLWSELASACTKLELCFACNCVLVGYGIAEWSDSDSLGDVPNSRRRLETWALS